MCLRRWPAHRGPPARCRSPRPRPNNSSRRGQLGLIRSQRKHFFLRHSHCSNAKHAHAWLSQGCELPSSGSTNEHRDTQNTEWLTERNTATSVIASPHSSVVALLGCAQVVGVIGCCRSQKPWDAIAGHCGDLDIHGTAFEARLCHPTLVPRSIQAECYRIPARAASAGKSKASIDGKANQTFVMDPFAAEEERNGATNLDFPFLKAQAATTCNCESLGGQRIRLITPPSIVSAVWHSPPSPLRRLINSRPKFLHAFLPSQPINNSFPAISNSVLGWTLASP